MRAPGSAEKAFELGPVQARLLAVSALLGPFPMAICSSSTGRQWACAGSNMAAVRGAGRAGAADSAAAAGRDACGEALREAGAVAAKASVFVVAGAGVEAMRSMPYGLKIA